MDSNDIQHDATTHTSENRRETVEVLPADSLPVRAKFPKTHVNFWRGRLRRQRYGSKADGTYREVQAVYVRIYHQGREHAFTFHTLNETVAASCRLSFSTWLMSLTSLRTVREYWCDEYPGKPSFLE
jgi:hypothetical protein